MNTSESLRDALSRAGGQAVVAPIPRGTYVGSLSVTPLDGGEWLVINGVDNNIFSSLGEAEAYIRATFPGERLIWSWH